MRTLSYAITALILAVATGGCGGASSTSSSSTTTSGGRSVRSVERALIAHGGPPAPTAVHCHVSSAAERAAAPFGQTRLPEFTCKMTVGGRTASYAVQVLRNNCFVAERRGGGQAVYGCGAARPGSAG